MSPARKALYALLAVAVCLLAPQVRLYPPDDLRIGKSFLVMDGGYFHHARPHLERAYAAYRAGCLPEEQAADLLVLYGLMLERGGNPAAAEPVLAEVSRREPAAAEKIARLRRELP